MGAEVLVDDDRSRVFVTIVFCDAVYEDPISKRVTLLGVAPMRYVPSFPAELSGIVFMHILGARPSMDLRVLVELVPAERAPTIELLSRTVEGRFPLDPRDPASLHIPIRLDVPGPGVLRVCMYDSDEEVGATLLSIQAQE